MSSSVSTDRGMVIISQVYPQGQDTLPAFAPQTQSVLPASHFPQMSSSLKRFQKGEPKALGVVQIMVGQLILILGVFMIFQRSLSVYTGVPFWGPMAYITSGALSIAADKKLKPSLVKAALSMNIVSAVGAGISIIVNFLQILFDHSYYTTEFNFKAITGSALILSVLEFCVAISSSVYGCKAVCNSDPAPVIVIQYTAQPQPVTQNASDTQYQLVSNTDVSSIPKIPPPAYAE
ncbi:membrane-spanning 4-domains subfamily A member 4A-like isoform X1 [Lepisosteus oculatus]|uniref:membrane-spanning 4-domains subfamily A member 4A-like isoform X1 n=1 Tax=Lepisosteus oculatus TaxID=7918 RepID=UPI0007401B44|nr:PREDICTED: membrane-spanning 4-domains subfamily A member 4A-like isoform X1 [Lepisosteus oculatus]